MKIVTFNHHSDSPLFPDIVYYSVQSKVAGVSEATAVTTRWIRILITFKNGDGGGTVIKNPINKKAIGFCVSSYRSRISW